MNNPVSNTCGKFEVLVKPLTHIKVLTPTSIISALSTGFKIRVSSIYSNFWHLKNAYFEFNLSNKEWCAETLNKSQWLSISSAVKMKWKRIKMAFL